VESPAILGGPLMIRRVMPWQATAPGDVTILRAPGRRLTKLITETGIVGYDNVLRFEREAVRIETVEDLAGLLEDLAGQTDACIIRGVLKPEFAGQRLVLRRSRDHPGVAARFAEVPRSWLMVDLEHVACPPGIDPTDPVLVGGALRRYLPDPFKAARCVAQLSSQTGLEPGLRAHLWFMLDRAVSDLEAKRWLKDAPVDLAIYQPVGIHYVASPVFDGVDDPCHERLAVLPGYPEVAVPDLPDRPARQTFTLSISGATVRGFGPAGAERYAAACLRNLALAPEGRRHPTCVAVSCRLLALAKSGLLDPVRVASQIKGVMRGRGFDGRQGRDLSEIDSILAWSWAQVEPEGLPHVR
jgi:hypothetical protein